MLAGDRRERVSRVRMWRPGGVGKGRGVGMGDVWRRGGGVSCGVWEGGRRETYEVGGKLAANGVREGDGVVAY